MAVREDDYVKKTYYKIWDGRVVREWFQDEKPEGFSNVTKRITSESKKTVWFKPYIFSGVLTDAYEKKNESINAYQFHIVLDDESVLVMNSGSGYHKSFLKLMENLPKSEELTFSPYNFMDRERNKKVIGMTVKDEEGQKIEFRYTKDDPNGLPQPKKNRKGEWNWTAQEEFLDEKFEAWKKEYFAEPDEGKSEPVEAGEVEDDDVPF